MNKKIFLLVMLIASNLFTQASEQRLKSSGTSKCMQGLVLLVGIASIVKGAQGYCSSNDDPQKWLAESRIEVTATVPASYPIPYHKSWTSAYPLCGMTDKYQREHHLKVESYVRQQIKEPNAAVTTQETSQLDCSSEKGIKACLFKCYEKLEDMIMIYNG